MAATTLRAFIAIELPPAIRDPMARIMESLDRGLPRRSVRWVRPDGIHLTLKFLGDTPASQLDHVQSLMAAAAREVTPFECVVAGLGCFPSPRQPRIVWVGLHEPSGVLNRLQRAIEAGAARLGYPKDDRPFNPHLTLGRLGREVQGQDARRVGENVQVAGVGELGTFRVEAVSLMSSDLRRGGPVYTRLYQARLAEG